MSTMPEDFQETAARMDLGTESGHLDLEKTAKTFVSKVDENKSMKKIITGLSIGVALLIGSIFGVSIAAAYLAKDTYVDSSSGMMMAKHGSNAGTPIKTAEQPLAHLSNVTVYGLSVEALSSLEKIKVGNSETPVEFVVKGFARGPNATMILVEGGTLSYSVDGNMDATGSALTLLMTAFGEENFVENGGNGRRLQIDNCDELPTHDEDGLFITKDQDGEIAFVDTSVTGAYTALCKQFVIRTDVYSREADIYSKMFSNYGFKIGDFFDEKTSNEICGTLKEICGN